MPTYRYKCLSCGQEIERFQKISDAALRECLSCGAELIRLINAEGGVIVKGQQKGAMSPCEQQGCALQHGGCPMAGMCGSGKFDR